MILGLVIFTICVIVGCAFGGPFGGFLGAVVGYFLALA